MCFRLIISILKEMDFFLSLFYLSLIFTFPSLIVYYLFFQVSIRQSFN